MDARDIVWLILIGLFFLIRYIFNESNREKRVERASDEDVAKAKYGVLDQKTLDELTPKYNFLRECIMEHYIKWTIDPYDTPYGRLSELESHHSFNEFYDPGATEAHMLVMFQKPRNAVQAGQMVFVMVCEAYREYMTDLGKRFIDQYLEHLTNETGKIPEDWKTLLRLDFKNEACRDRLVMMANAFGRGLIITEEQLLQSIAEEDPKRAERVRKQMAKDKLKAEKKKARKN